MPWSRSVRRGLAILTLSAAAAIAQPAAQPAAPAAPAAPQPAAAPLALSIEDAMKLAVGVSPGVAAARASRSSADAGVTSAQAGYWPQINLSASYVRTLRSQYQGLFTTPSGSAAGSGSGSGSGSGGAPMGLNLSELPFGLANNYSVGATAAESIWDGGRTGGAVDVARRTVDAAALDVRAQQAQAVLEVTQAYYAAALAERVVDIDTSSLSLAERTLADAQARFAKGLAAEFDVVRAQASVANERTAAAQARSARDLAELHLRVVLGLPRDRALQLTSGLGEAELAPLARQSADVHDTRGERVAVAQARTTVALREAQLSLAQADRWPTFSVVSDLGLVDYPTHLYPNSRWLTNWTVGVDIAFPLFTGFRTTAQIDRARADVRAAQAQLAGVQQAAEVDTATATSDLAVARATLASAQEAVQLAQRAYDIAELRFHQGLSTYLELADARLSLDQAKLQQAQAARDVQVGNVRVALLPALPLAQAAGGEAGQPGAAAQAAQAAQAPGTSPASVSAASAAPAGVTPPTAPATTPTPMPGGVP